MINLNGLFSKLAAFRPDSLFPLMRNKIEGRLKLAYYKYFIESKRRKASRKTLEKRLRIMGVPLIPISQQQKEQVHKRFGKFIRDYKWFDYYNTVYKTNHPDKDYDVTKVVPGVFFYPYIDALFAHPKEALTLSDKNLTDLLFADVCRPKTIMRYCSGFFMDSSYGVITKEEAFNRCIQEKSVVIKPSHLSGAGRGIVFWNYNSDGIDVLERVFSSTKNYIVQEIAKQHERMNSLYAGSINTIRIESFIWNNEVIILSSAVRMGANGSKVDNLSDGGGMSCGVDLKTGQLTSKAYDYYHLNVTYDKHPQGCAFDGFIIPSWDKCVHMVKRVAPRFARVSKLIAWDIAIREDGEPMLIECNMMDSGCEILQLNNGPLFGEITDEVISMAKTKRRNRI